MKQHFFRVMNSGAYDFCGYKRTPDVIAPDMDDDIDEGEVDWDEKPDDDEE